MEPLQILERYFNSFIGSEDPKQFFMGLKDYLDYGDAVPEFDLITTQVSAMPKELMERYEKQHNEALSKIKEAHKKIAKYVAKNKVEIPVVLNALKQYDSFEQKRSTSSWPLAYTLHDELHDAIEFLYRTPEHKEFAEKFIEFSDPTKAHARHYLPIKELDDFLETKKEFERQYENELWGAQQHLYELCKIVREGHAMGKEVIARAQRKEPGAVFDWMNFSVIMSEWMKIEEGRPERDPVFFKPKEVRPKAQRFHLYVLSRFAAAHAALAEVKQEKPLSFDENEAVLWVKNKPFPIRRVSDQYDLLRVIFADPAEVGKEWFFDEIAEKVDPARSNERLKKYYNAAYQISKKLAEKGLPGFFITKRHSARIGSTYLS
ncbi:MAG: hypothetical protein ABSE76_00495 [Minisyncoccia bacterium]|jgi:hypothetical protein